MPLTNDGNERDVRIRPDAAPIEGADQNLKGPIPVGNPCATTGSQTDLPKSGYSIETPSGSFEQTYDWANLAALCPRGLDMRTIETLIFQLLVSHFSDPARIINPELKDLIYTTNPLTTKIRIVLNTTYDLATATKLPAVILKRGEQKFARIGLNDRGERKFPTTSGIYPFVRNCEGTHVLMAVSSVPGETENIANELLDAFTCVSPVMRSQLPFADFEVVGVSELQVSDELGNRSVVAVQLLYKYELGWTMRYATPLVGAIDVRTLVTTQGHA
jgi:hypothetical protein